MNKQNDPNWIQMYREQIIKPIQRTRITEQRGRTETSQSGFYTTKEWIKIRDIRRSIDPLCVECLKKGRTVPMTTVDHIITIEERPDLALELSNTQSLCNIHHILKTNADKKRNNEAKRLESGRKLMQELEGVGGSFKANTPPTNHKPKIELFFCEGLTYRGP